MHPRIGTAFPSDELVGADVLGPGVAIAGEGGGGHDSAAPVWAPLGPGIQRKRTEPATASDQRYRLSLAQTATNAEVCFRDSLYPVLAASFDMVQPPARLSADRDFLATGAPSSPVAAADGKHIATSLQSVRGREHDLLAPANPAEATGCVDPAVA